MAIHIASLSDVVKDVPWAGKQKPSMSFPQKGVYVNESYHNWVLPIFYELEKLIAARPEIKKVINDGKITGAEEISDK